MSLHKDIPPLFVDLDGTLVRTDLLHEGVFSLLKVSIWYLFLLPLWLLKGKAYFKYKVAETAQPDFSLLPYDSLFLDFLYAEKKKGRKLYLATASNSRYAEKVAEHLDIFDDVLASSPSHNLKGRNKLIACQKISNKFAYAGNATEDFDIFKESIESHLVNPGRAALAMARKSPVTKIWYRETSSTPVKTWFKALRIHQWLKNTLLFVPLFAAGKYYDQGAIVHLALGFLSFSLLASATYLVNDLLDLDADRQHPRKRLRPFASGDLSITKGVSGLLVLSIIILLLASYTPLGFQICLLGYLIFTLMYSFALKYYVIADVIALAGLFTVRIIGGALIIEVALSFWLLAFSMFTFFSLALVKRCAEIKMLEQRNKFKSSGRDYNVDDYNLMQSLGVSSAFMSILLMAFYVQDAYIGSVYSNPVVLWLTIPAFVYWLCRMWLKTSRGEMHDDPIIFSLKDRGSIITIAFICLVTLMAKF